jgi:hypothetical protein
MVAGTQMEYTHQELGSDCNGLAGYYTPQKEVRLEFEGREVLYILGRAVIEASCCGVGNWNYVLVPGYIVNWHSRTNEAGLPVSRVEPITDGKTRDQIKKIVRDKEGIDWVSFWQ